MKIIVVQNKVEYSKSQNFKQIDDLLLKENLKDFDFIVLPEMFSCPYELDMFDKHKEDLDGESIRYLKSLAIKYSCYVVGGSIPFKDKSKLYNTTFIFNRIGDIIARYDKIHLFEVVYPDGTTFNESNKLSRGDNVVTFDTEFGPMGVMICFDIRFPELSYELMKKNASVIFVPAAFNTYTGPMHWSTTFQSRAIDNQLFIVGSSPSSNSVGDYNVYGHSLVVDPFGKILFEMDNTSGCFTIDLDLSKINEARSKIPIIRNRVFK